MFDDYVRTCMRLSVIELVYQVKLYSSLLIIAIATKVFIGKLPATRGVWVIIG